MRLNPLAPLILKAHAWLTGWRSMAVPSQSEPRGPEERSLVRMNFRTKPSINATIQRAAALAGLGDSAFTMQAA